MSPAPLRRRRSTFNPFLAVLLGGVAVVGILLTLHFTDQVELPFIDAALGREVRAQETAVDTVAVLVTARELGPGEAVTRLDVWDPAVQNFKFVHIPREKVKDEWILRWPDIEGRVLAHAKHKDKAFKESDFLPKGTRPGVAALVPPGMRMVTIPAGRVAGLEALRFEDRFDLVAQYELDEEMIKEAKDELAGVSLDAQADLDRLMGKSSKRTVCHLAMRLTDLPSGATGKQKPVAIAVAESEVAGVLDALKSDAQLDCLTYSGTEARFVSHDLDVEEDLEEEIADALGGTVKFRIREGRDSRMIRVVKYQEPEGPRQ